MILFEKFFAIYALLELGIFIKWTLSIETILTILIIPLLLRLFLGISKVIELIALYALFIVLWHLHPYEIHEPQQILSLLFLYLILDKSSSSTQTKTWLKHFVLAFLCLYYFMAGLKKLPDPDWIQGSAIQRLWDWGALNQFDLYSPIVSQLVPVFKFATWFTLAFELLFPFFFYTRLRRYLLLVGALFHLGVSLVFNVGTFGLVMMLWYLLAI